MGGGHSRGSRSTLFLQQPQTEPPGVISTGNHSQPLLSLAQPQPSASSLAHSGEEGRTGGRIEEGAIWGEQSGPPRQRKALGVKGKSSSGEGSFGLLLTIVI